MVGRSDLGLGFCVLGLVRGAADHACGACASAPFPRFGSPVHVCSSQDVERLFWLGLESNSYYICLALLQVPNSVNLSFCTLSRSQLVMAAKVGKGGRRALCTTIFAMLLLMSLVLLVLLAVGMLGVPSGITPTESLRESLELHSQFHDRLVWTEAISWEPRASVFHNFLTDEECDHLINLAKPRMKKSAVVDNETGRSKDSRVRTSSGTFLRRGQDDIISRIEERIAKFTFIPKEHGEGLQVLHYEVGQKYDAHHDYFHDSVNTRNGGQRIATVLMYLTDVGGGGETVFPNAKVNSSSVPWWDELSECAKEGVSARPRRGDALLFWSMTPNAQLDPYSLHGGCPVIKGNKWSATKWLHLHEYEI